MKHCFTSLIILLLLGTAGLWPLRAQTLDPAFQPTVLKMAVTSPNLQNYPQIVVTQPDGKVLVGGGFDFVNGTVAGKIQRLNPDGTTDPSFNPGGLGANGFLASIVLQPDGKILLGGGFTAYNGAPALTVARLNANGTLDATFTASGLVSLQQVGALALQPDGKILVGGGLSLQGTAPNGALTRLNANGTADATFNIGTGVTSNGGFVRSILVQADGKILVGGTFTTFNGQTVGNLVRLTTTGGLDAGFTIGTGTDGAVRAMAQQADGKILLGGAFTALNGQPAPRLARLLLNGPLDNTFDVGTGPNNAVVSLLIQSNGGAQFNGSIVFSGNFTLVNGQARSRVARVFDNGTLDASFGTGVGAGTNSTVTSLAQIGTGEFLAAGSFMQYDGVAKTGITRLGATGANSTTFAATTEARGTIGAVVPLANGQLLVSGSFSEFNGVAITGNAVRRLNANGSLDQTYSTTYLGLLGAQPDGNFYSLSSNGTQFQLLHTLPSGAGDANFTSVPFGSTSAMVLSAFQGITVQPNGRPLVFGNFSTFGTAARNGIARLNLDGTLDNTFTPPTSTVARAVVSAAVQPSGKIVVTYREIGPGAAIGTFIVRLNTDGTLDNSFNTGTGAGTGMFFSVLAQPDGKLLVTGVFTTFNGQATPYGIVRLDVDGAVDPTFNGLATGYSLRLVQPDGRILATTLGQYGATTLVRLNSSGSLDNTFAPVAIPLAFFIGEDLLGGLALQPVDNKIVVYGSFRSVAGQLRIGLARLTNPGVTATRAATAALPLEVYPNPTSQRLTVLLPASALPLQATLLDLTGRAVRHWTLPAHQPTATLDLGATTAGVYVLRIPGPAGTYQQKVVVTH